MSAPNAEVVAGRYRVQSLLGRGGVGQVHRAHDEATGEPVALKQLNEDRLDNQSVRLMFQREYHTLARLDHPCIVRVHDFGIEGDRPYYTMELIDGEALGPLLPLGPQRACRVLRDVASALAYLHARNLIHRDVSMRNVRVTGEGTAKLIDFGTLATQGVV